MRLVRLVRSLAALLGCTFFVLALSGCARHGSPESAALAGAGSASRLLGPAQDGPPLTLPLKDARSRLPYPLAVGNEWDYRVTTHVALVTAGGRQPPLNSEHALNVAIVGTAQIGEREYFIQSESDPLLGAPPTVFPVRQDRSGLFERDALFSGGATGMTARAAAPPSATAAALRDYIREALGSASQQAAFQRAASTIAARFDALRHAGNVVAGPWPGGPDAGEISMLRYPLHVGARWIVRDSPRFARAVMARERVQVPAGPFIAWRLRGTSELFGPADRVRFWYSRAGLLRISAHIEADATDDTGSVIGRLIMDQEQVLESFRLVNPDGPQKSAEAAVEGTESE